MTTALYLWKKPNIYKNTENSLTNPHVPWYGLHKLLVPFCSRVCVCVCQRVRVSKGVCVSMHACIRVHRHEEQEYDLGAIARCCPPCLLRRDFSLAGTLQLGICQAQLPRHMVITSISVAGFFFYVSYGDGSQIFMLARHGALLTKPSPQS